MSALNTASPPKHFYISAEEINKTRRAPFLPVLLILAMAAMFGFDASKSQPLHFLMVFFVAILFSIAVVSIGLHGARRQVDEYKKCRLTIGADSITWSAAGGDTTLSRSTIISATATIARGKVRVIQLSLADGSQRTLEAYDDMDGLFQLLRRVD